jgi:phage tail protein X
MNPRILRTLVVVLIALGLAACTPGRPPAQSSHPQMGPLPLQVRNPSQAVSTPAREGLTGHRPTGTAGFYRVAKNDNVYSIAREFYGSEEYAQDILEYNKKTIRSAGGLKRGLVIALPEFADHPITLPDARP